VLRRIPRIICTRCGRPRVTTVGGWHLCPNSGRHRQTRGPVAVWLAAVVAAIAGLTWVLLNVWP